ncbi:replication initiation protein (plasmid) [Shewanella sp. KX20019]|uniref:replication initiation protein n=1 Tax=Shewanella sp. KX20019 TaxID=2803864 RepID=UPI0019284BB6|nr:replication initiation protein [Shewanella sp. KX20019]QQX82688.1 replication initiation protein [Shewanella sp. KX20019]
MKPIKKPHHAMIARMNFSARERDLITLMYRGVKSAYDKEYYKSKKVDIDSLPNVYEFTKDELFDVFNLSKQGLYDALDSSTDGVMSKLISIKLPNENKFKKKLICYDAEFSDGVLKLAIHPDFIPSMVDYSKGYTEFDLNLQLSLSGNYEKLILELISRFKNNKNYVLTLGEYCDLFQINVSDYSRPQVFFNTVLNKPIQRLIKASNGVWTAKEGFDKGYSVIKSGRSYKDSDKIIFKMKYNDPDKSEIPLYEQLNAIRIEKNHGLLMFIDAAIASLELLEANVITDESLATLTTTINMLNFNDGIDLVIDKDTQEMIDFRKEQGDQESFCNPLNL